MYALAGNHDSRGGLRERFGAAAGTDRDDGYFQYAVSHVQPVGDFGPTSGSA